MPRDNFATPMQGPDNGSGNKLNVQVVDEFGFTWTMGEGGDVMNSGFVVTIPLNTASKISAANTDNALTIDAGAGNYLSLFTIQYGFDGNNGAVLMTVTGLFPTDKYTFPIAANQQGTLQLDWTLAGVSSNAQTVTVTIPAAGVGVKSYLNCAYKRFF
jgi:hypothetical protein